MNIIQNIINALALTPNGGIFTVELIRPAKVRKAFEAMGMNCHSWMQGRLNEYSAGKAVREAVEAGTREAPQLPKHIASAERIEGRVKIGLGHNGMQYFMFPLVDSKNHGKAFYLDGVEQAFDSVKDALLAAEFSSKDAASARAQGQDIYSTTRLDHLWKINGVVVQDLNL